MDSAAILRAYRRVAPVYDIIFGLSMAPGRKLAARTAASGPGQRILEVGVGTGLALPYYRRDCTITGIDLSSEMLGRARQRVARMRMPNVEALLHMNAEELDFEDESFDTVVCMYVVSVAENPARVLHEMARVCVPGGSILIVNHFRAPNGVRGAVERRMAPLSETLGWRPHMEFDGLFRFRDSAGIEVVSARPVQPFGLFTLVRCRKLNGSSSLKPPMPQAIEASRAAAG